MKKSDRLLGGFTVAELEHLYASRSHEPRVLRALRDELRYRKPSKTEVLRQRVDRHFTDRVEAEHVRAPTSQPVILQCLGCRTKLRLNPAKPRGVATCPHCGQGYSVSWSGASCLVLPHIAAARAATNGTQPMSLEQARTVLGVSSMDDWDTVKKASRSLLQQLHPDRIGDTPPAVQKAAEAEFNRVKEALAVIEPMLKPSSAAIS